MKALILFFCLLTTAAFSQEDEKFEKVIRIGVNIMSPPFCFLTRNPKTDEIDTVGVDIDIARILAKKFDARPIWVPIYGAEYREEALKSKSVDFIVAVYSITEERKAKVNFSNPYYEIEKGKGLAILTGVNSGIEGTANLKGRRYGYVRSSITDDFVNDSIRWEIKHYSGSVGISMGLQDQTIQMEMLFNKEIDAVIDDYNLLQYWERQLSNEYKLFPIYNAPEDRYGIAIGERFSGSASVGIVNMLADSLYNNPKIIQAMISHFITVPPLGGPIEGGSDLIGIIVLVVPVLSLMVMILMGQIKARREAKDKERRREEKIQQRKARAAQKKKDEEEKKKQDRERRMRERKEKLDAENYCLIIANSEYQFIPGFQDHPYEDAEAIKDALVDYGFKRDNVCIFEDATRKGLIKSFQDLVTRKENHNVPFANKLRNGIDNLIIYFSGHGHMINLQHNQTGFWMPVDAVGSWDYIPDYEIRFFITSMNLNQILLISDSCFSNSLIGSERLTQSVDSTEYTIRPCVEIITAGISRVPAESKFRVSLVDTLTSNPKEILLSHQLYEGIKSRLTNIQSYQPQFGSLWSSEPGARFHLIKGTSNGSKANGSLANGHESLSAAEVRNRILKAFNGNRFLPYEDLSKNAGVSAMEFTEGIKELTLEGRIHVTSDNTVFFKK